MEVYRIHDRRLDALSGLGAARQSGRWNPVGVPVVYTSLAYEGTLLEVIARAGARRFPVDHVASRIEVPESCGVEVLEEAGCPDWHDRASAHEIGRAWVDTGRAVALVVPSFVARPWGRNVVLNPRHPDFGAVRVSEVLPATWDVRLF